MQAFFEQYPFQEEVIAAGVSGGADSLALVLRLAEWCAANRRRVVALTVNHRLRPEAGEEAAYVAEIMSRFGIEHHVLEWRGKKPNSGIEEAAREARYRLLAEWCRENRVSVLATGHHLRDQAETFLLRLIRGSGVSGLSGILPVSERDGLKIIRPQLFDKPEVLKAFLIDRGVRWVEDPSNQNREFLRVKIRKFLPVLEKELGLSEERLAATADVMRRTRFFLEEKTDAFIQAYCRWFAEDICFFELSDFFAQHEEMRFRVLSRLLKVIGKKPYVPEAAEVLRLCSLCERPEFNGATLGGCALIRRGGKIWIVPENREKRTIGRQAWKDFVLRHPEYRKEKIPAGVKFWLVVEESEKPS